MNKFKPAVVAVTKRNIKPDFYGGLLLSLATANAFFSAARV